MNKINEIKEKIRQYQLSRIKTGCQTEKRTLSKLISRLELELLELEISESKIDLQFKK